MATRKPTVADIYVNRGLALAHEMAAFVKAMVKR